MVFRWDYVAALRFPWPCATGDLTTERRAAACGPGLLLSCPPPYGRKRPTDEDKKNSARYPSGASFCCDPVGIRTQDPQLRRLLLYPTELPDRSVCRFARFAMGVKSGCKDNFISSKAQNYFSKGLAFIIFAVFPVALFLTAFFRKVFFLTVFFWEIFYREVFVGVVAGDHCAGEFDGDYQYEAEEGEDDGAADVHVDHA